MEDYLTTEKPALPSLTASFPTLAAPPVYSLITYKWGFGQAYGSQEPGKACRCAKEVTNLGNGRDSEFLLSLTWGIGVSGSQLVL